MVQLGYKLMSEEQGPQALVRNAVRAEEAGFDFVAISDHFFPWLDAEGHAPFAWSVLGAIAHATERVGITTAVTCPTVRYHPAIVAQAAATVGVLSNGRFSLGLGTGELLNEHVVAPRWPSAGPRLSMLGEAITIIRKLFDGEVHSFRGDHFEIEEARLYDLPAQPPPILVAAGAEQAATLAAEAGDGLFTTGPDSEVVQLYRRAGGSGPRYTEVSLAYAGSKEDAHELLETYYRWSVFDWKVLPELPTPAAFDAASRNVRAEDLAQSQSAGPDADGHVTAVRKCIDAGFDHVVLNPIGPEQDRFFDFFERELSPRLREAA